MMKKYQQYTAEIGQAAYDVFLAALLWYGVSMAIEQVWPGVIVRYFNLNYLFLAVMASALMAVAWRRDTTA